MFKKKLAYMITCIGWGGSTRNIGYVVTDASNTGIPKEICRVLILIAREKNFKDGHDDYEDCLLFRYSKPIEISDADADNQKAFFILEYESNIPEEIVFKYEDVVDVLNTKYDFHYCQDPLEKIDITNDGLTKLVNTHIGNWR